MIEFRMVVSNVALEKWALCEVSRLKLRISIRGMLTLMTQCVTLCLSRFYNFIAIRNWSTKLIVKQ